MTQVIDFNEVIADTDKHMQRIGWDKEKAQQHLIDTYGKNSRLKLNDQQLLEFRDFLVNYQDDGKLRIRQLKFPSLRLGGHKTKSVTRSVTLEDRGIPPF